MNVSDFNSYCTNCCICNSEMYFGCRINIIIETQYDVDVVGSLYYDFEDGKFIKSGFGHAVGYKVKMKKIFKSASNQFYVKNDPFPKISHVKKHLKKSSLSAYYHKFCLCNSDKQQTDKMHEYESTPIFGRKASLEVDYESIVIDGYKIVNYMDLANSDFKTVILHYENDITKAPRYEVLTIPISSWNANDIESFRRKISSVILLS